MLNQIMKEIKNHFARCFEIGKFEIVADGIQGTFTQTYVVGAYVWIKNSFVNDGVYKITQVATNKITLDATLTAENTNEEMVLYLCTPPKDFIDLANKIITYNTTNSDGISSKSLGDLSISYSGDSTWVSVFKGQLNTYRKVYDDDVRSEAYDIYRC